MLGRPQTQPFRMENHHHKTEAMNYTVLENTGILQKPKTRRGGVKARGRAARRAQRLALEEQQRAEEKKGDQETIEAAGSGLGMMKHALREYHNNAESFMSFETMQHDRFLAHDNSTRGAMSIESMRRNLHEYHKRVPEDAIGSSASAVSTDEECANTAKRGSDDDEEEWCLGVVDRGCGKCLCTLVCVCNTSRCLCADKCYCD